MISRLLFVSVEGDKIDRIILNLTYNEAKNLTAVVCSIDNVMSPEPITCIA